MPTGVKRWKCRLVLLISTSLLCALAIVPEVLYAEMHGYVDLLYSSQDASLNDATGTTDLKTKDFRQQYYLILTRDIYPNLKFTGSGLFEKEKINTKLDGEETDSTLTTVQPYLDLTLRTPLITTGVTYNGRERTLKTSGAPTVTLVNDNYLFSLLYAPEGLPLLDSHIERSRTYDKDRSSVDVTQDYAYVSVRYSPTPGLNLEYRPVYLKTEDKLNNITITDTTNRGRVDYSGQFFNGRVTVYGRADVARIETKTEAKGSSGNVSFQIIPFQGLSAIDDTPLEGSLDANPALIDGNVDVSAGINIGLPPPEADSKERNMGLDFFSDAKVSHLLVWVDRELPEQIANSFTWDIYVSSDNLRWSLLERIPAAPFGPFQNRFELRFSSVTTRYIKAVTRPLGRVVPEATSFPDILVTEVQAFSTTPVQDVKGTLTRTNQIYDLGAKVRILDSPSLFYELVYTSAKSGNQKRSVLSNGLIATHQFSRIFSGYARVAREDNTEPLFDSTAYVYSASLAAVPLGTLSHTLTFSGRFEESGGRHADRNSAYLFNTAELYRGLSLTLTGGVDFMTLDTGQKETDTLLTANLTATPHPTLSLNLYYSDATQRPSGGDDQRTEKFLRRTDLLVAYNPFRSLYLFADLGFMRQESGNRTLRNFGVNWSPFPDGALQFTFYYNEDFDSQQNSTIRTVQPSVYLKLGGKSYLTVSYLMIKSDSDIQNSETKTFSANLRVGF